MSEERYKEERGKYRRSLRIPGWGEKAETPGWQLWRRQSAREVKQLLYVTWYVVTGLIPAAESCLFLPWLGLTVSHFLSSSSFTRVRMKKKMEKTTYVVNKQIGRSNRATRNLLNPTIPKHVRKREERGERPVKKKNGSNNSPIEANLLVIPRK